MKFVKLGFAQLLVLALIIAAVFGLTYLLHHAIAERAVRFAIFIPSVFLMMVLFFTFVRPARPYDLALTLTVILEAATSVLVVVKDFIIDKNYTPRVIFFFCFSAAVPFLAAAVYNRFSKKHPA